MGLILGIRKGKKFYVDDEPVTVVEIEDHTRVTLSVKGRLFKVYDDKATEILPNVKVFCGKPSDDTLTRAERRVKLEGKTLADMVARLVIEAPRHMKILRSKLYAESKRVRDSGRGDPEGRGKRDKP